MTIISATTIPFKQKNRQRANEILHSISLDHYYRYDILQPLHVKQVVDFFTRSFCDFEPMTRYVNMEYESFAVFARAVTKKAAKDELSVVALDGDRVIACALVEDLLNPLVMKFAFDPKFNCIFSLLEKLTADFFAEKKFLKNQISHLFITAVDPAYQGQGLSKQVNFRAMALAANEGFSFMVSELTHFYNEKGIIHHLKNESLLLGSQVYEDYIFEGRQPFPTLSGSAKGYLWELYQNAALCYEENHVKYTKLLNALQK